MTTTTPQPLSLKRTPGGQSIKAPSRRRRRPWQAGLGVALVVLCGAVAATIFQSSSHRVSVIIATQSLQAGSVLTSADLGVGSLPASDNISALSASTKSSLVGQQIAVPVEKGQLMVGSMISATPPLSPGYQLAGVLLKGDQLPTVPIVAGDTVQVIAVPPPTQVVGGAVNGPAQADVGITLVAQAIVIASGPPPVNQRQYAASISIEIPASAATAVAEYSAADQIAFTLVGRSTTK